MHHASKEQFDLNSLLMDVMKSKYSAPIANYIDWLNEIKVNRKNKNGQFHKLAEEVKKIISGKYSVDPEGQIYFQRIRKVRHLQVKLNFIYRHPLLKVCLACGFI